MGVADASHLLRLKMRTSEISYEAAVYIIRSSNIDCGTTGLTVMTAAEKLLK